jgi:3'(2'), 5'-bisphosphate nucleotidase
LSDPFLSHLDAVITLAQRAGAEIARLYRIHCDTPVAPDRKADGSPVTAADHASEAVLMAGLRNLAPSVPILSEEQVAKGVATDVSGGTYWCVDPLDGTKEYLNRTDEFTVCVAGMVGFRPVFGVLHAPVLGLSFAGAGGKAWRVAPDGARSPMAARPRPQDGGLALISRSHRAGDEEERFLEQAGIRDKRGMGSAIKFGLIAAGEADLYVRCGPTSEWDTAAGQAVLEAAGGCVVTLEGEPLGYGKPKFLNGSFIAKGR